MKETRSQTTLCVRVCMRVKSTFQMCARVDKVLGHSPWHSRVAALWTDQLPREMSSRSQGAHWSSHPRRQRDEVCLRCSRVV